MLSPRSYIIRPCCIIIFFSGPGFPAADKIIVAGQRTFGNNLSIFNVRQLISDLFLIKNTCILLAGLVFMAAGRSLSLAGKRYQDCVKTRQPSAGCYRRYVDA